MDLSYTPTQETLRNEARALLGEADVPAILATVASPPGYDVERWRAVLRRGWPTLSFDTATGGAGGGLSDLAVFAEELGRSALPTPFHNGLVQAGMVLAALGTNEANDHLRALLSGVRRYALCLAEDDGSYRLDRFATTARAVNDHWTIEGTKGFVPYLDSADVLLVVTRTTGAGATGRGLAVFAVESSTDGVVRSTLDTIGWERMGQVKLSVPVGGEAQVGHFANPGVLQTALVRAAIVLSADVVGAAAAAFDCAIARVSERPVFGQPVGSYQAVQHRAADMLIDLTSARDAVVDTAGMADRGDDISYAASVAKAHVAEACQRVTAGSHQIFGGEGIFADRPLHLWFRRVKAAEPMLGDPRFHRERIASFVFGDPGAGPGFHRYPTRI